MLSDVNGEGFPSGLSGRALGNRKREVFLAIGFRIGGQAVMVTEEGPERSQKRDESGLCLAKMGCSDC